MKRIYLFIRLIGLGHEKISITDNSASYNHQENIFPSLRVFINLYSGRVPFRNIVTRKYSQEKYPAKRKNALALENVFLKILTQLPSPFRSTFSFPVECFFFIKTIR